MGDDGRWPVKSFGDVRTTSRQERHAIQVQKVLRCWGVWAECKEEFFEDVPRMGRWQDIPTRDKWWISVVGYKKTTWQVSASWSKRKELPIPFTRLCWRLVSEQLWVHAQCCFSCYLPQHWHMLARPTSILHNPTTSISHKHIAVQMKHQLYKL